MAKIQRMRKLWNAFLPEEEKKMKAGQSPSLSVQCREQLSIGDIYSFELGFLESNPVQDPAQ